MHRISLLIASVVISSLLVPTGFAADRQNPTLTSRVHVGESTARLTGRTPAGLRAVTLQRKVEGRWVKAARVRVNNRRYGATVPIGSQPRLYRVAATGGLRSPARVVPALTAGSSPDVADPPTPVDPGQVEPPTPTDPPTTDACGPQPVKADGSKWSCTFVDDFLGTTLDRAKWVPQTQFATGVASAYACYRDNPENVSVRDGALQLTLREHKDALACAQTELPPSKFTAGMVSTYRLFSQAHGRFEARIKNTATTSPGLHEAFWLWPDDRQSITVPWPEAGEIDIAETYSSNPDLAVPFLHYRADENGPVDGLNTAWDCRAERGVYSTYTLEWGADRVEIFVNGESCLVNTSGDEAFQRKYIVALTQGLGAGNNAYAGAVPIPATMSVDYVRVWE